MLRLQHAQAIFGLRKYQRHKLAESLVKTAVAAICLGKEKTAPIHIIAEFLHYFSADRRIAGQGTCTAA